MPIRALTLLNETDSAELLPIRALILLNRRATRRGLGMLHTAASMLDRRIVVPLRFNEEQSRAQEGSRPGSRIYAYTMRPDYVQTRLRVSHQLVLGARCASIALQPVKVLAEMIASVTSNIATAPALGQGERCH